MADRVCAKCFGDEDIATFIELEGGDPGCDFCDEDDAPTADLDDLGDFLRDRISQEYGQAVDQLPFETREGGFQGWHVDSYDMIFDQGIIELSRHSDELLEALVGAIDPDAIWSDYDWLSLDDDKAMSFSWDSFCETVKHHRHFFFDRAVADEDDRDRLTPLSLLERIALICEASGLVVEHPTNSRFYRARSREAGKFWTSTADLGAPPGELATQFNRMNPPGVAVTYVSETRDLALAEIREGRASVGEWRTRRPCRILNLYDLPAYPGLFSPLDRRERLGVRFLREFVREITKPVAGTSVVKLDYIPTQVVTEFFRDHPFEIGPIDGVRYPSATGSPGANIVLFADQADTCAFSDPDTASTGGPWLQLVAVEQAG